MGFFDYFGGGQLGGGLGGGMPYNTLAGLGMGLMGGTISDPYGAAMRGFAQGSQADALNAYRQQLFRNQADERAYQRERDKKSDDFRREQFQFQKDQADAAARGYSYEKDQDGNLIRLEKATGKASMVPVEGAPAASSNPYAAPGKPMTEAQSKDALYASRMFGAEKVFRDPAVMEAGASPVQRGMNAIPGVGNYMTSGNFQSFDQAARDFINATLRRESGAVISDKEFDNAYKQYLPRPGDSEQVLAQKQANRIEAIKGISAGAGRNYKVPYTFDDKGGIVGGQEKGAAASQSDPISEAREAIKRGADPNKVKTRLLQNGINPAGL